MSYTENLTVENNPQNNQENPNPVNVLILGNGFDLCLNKHTTWSDFVTYFYIVNLLCIFEYFARRTVTRLEQPPKESSAEDLNHFIFLTELYENFDYHKLAESVIENFREKSEAEYVTEREKQNFQRLSELTLLAENYLESLLKSNDSKASLIDHVKQAFKLQDNLFLQDFLEMLLTHCDENDTLENFIYVLTADSQYIHVMFLKHLNPDELDEQDNIESWNFYTFQARTNITPKVVISDCLENITAFDKFIQKSIHGDPQSKELLKRQGFLTGWLDVERFIEAQVTRNETLLRQFFLLTSQNKVLLYPEQEQAFKPELIPQAEFAAKAYQAGIKDFNRLFADFLLLQNPSEESTAEFEKFVTDKQVQ